MVAVAVAGVLVVVLIGLGMALIVHHMSDLGRAVTSVSGSVRSDAGKLLAGRDKPGPPVPPLPNGNAPATGATPMGNFSDWFSEDYYPPDAKRIGAEGLVRVELQLDAEGVPKDCVVVLSSDNASLDRKTCELAMKFGRFHPARDAAGRPVAAKVEMPPVRWQLRDDDE